MKWFTIKGVGYYVKSYDISLVNCAHLTCIQPYRCMDLVILQCLLSTHILQCEKVGIFEIPVTAVANDRASAILSPLFPHTPNSSPLFFICIPSNYTCSWEIINLSLHLVWTTNQTYMQTVENPHLVKLSYTHHRAHVIFYNLQNPLAI